jgi:hypothetical protein
VLALERFSGWGDPADGIRLTRNLMAETGEPWVSGGQHVVESARAANVYRLGVGSSTSISRLTRPICSRDAKGPSEGLGRFDLPSRWWSSPDSNRPPIACRVHG